MSQTVFRDFPTARQTRLGLLIVVPLALMLGPRAVAWAAYVAKTWQSSQSLKAADLTAEFKKVEAEFSSQDARLAKLEGEPKFMGSVDFTTPSNGTYKSAHAACAAAYSGAHVCSMDEVLRTRRSQAQAIENGWVIAGFVGYNPSTNIPIDDCNGMQNLNQGGATSLTGTYWSSTGLTFGPRLCSMSAKLLCCQ